MSPGMAKAPPVWMGGSLLDSSLKGMTRFGDPQVGSQHRRLRQDESEFKANALSQEKRRRKKRQFGDWCQSTSVPKKQICKLLGNSWFIDITVESGSETPSRAGKLTSHQHKGWRK